MNSIAATTLQSWLTQQWTRAEKRLDDPAPLTAGFWQSMDKWHEAAERFDAVENSLRRAGYEGCIGTPEKCAASVVSCRACGPVDDAGKVNPVKSTGKGRDRAGNLWLVETLSF